MAKFRFTIGTGYNTVLLWIGWHLDMTATPSVQDNFLQTLMQEKTVINVFLVNGIKLSGQLTGFDQFVVLLESGSGQGMQLVFKHAISTVMPANGWVSARGTNNSAMNRGKSNHSRARE